MLCICVNPPDSQGSVYANITQTQPTVVNIAHKKNPLSLPYVACETHDYFSLVVSSLFIMPCPRRRVKSLFLSMVFDFLVLL